MLKFIIGLILVIAAVVGAYYYLTIKEPSPSENVQKGATIDAQIQVTEKKIPAGAIMEDGTIPE